MTIRLPKIEYGIFQINLNPGASREEINVFGSEGWEFVVIVGGPGFTGNETKTPCLFKKINGFLEVDEA